jgi:transposase InsO family protein
MARLAPGRPTEHWAPLASPGMDGLLAVAVPATRRGGRPPLQRARRALIRRMAVENRLWGQRRVQAELARLGFPVSARTVVKSMRRPYDGVPSPTWRTFLTDHAKNIWACDFLGVRTVFFRTLYVLFVMHHETRQILQVRVTRHPTADWTAQQVVDTCGRDRDPPRYLIRDRDSRYPEVFDRRLRGLGVRQLRTPLKAPRANALAERWVRSARTECLDHLFIVDERHLASAGRVRRLLQCVASSSGARPAGAVRISSDGPVQSDGPNRRAAGAWGPPSCVSPCCLMGGWSCCALQAC